MTDEQIKQNAETAYPGFEDLQAVYIEGAHSINEEIKELKEEIESLQEHYNTCFDGFTKRGTKLGELMKENVKLRNPWISVDERLPEIEDEKEERTGEVFVCIKDDVFLVAHYSYFYKAWYTFSDKGGCMYRKIRTPRYWMPIPELKN